MCSHNSELFLFLQPPPNPHESINWPVLMALVWKIWPRHRNSNRQNQVMFNPTSHSVIKFIPNNLIICNQLMNMLLIMFLEWIMSKINQSLNTSCCLTYKVLPLENKVRCLANQITREMKSKSAYFCYHSVTARYTPKLLQIFWCFTKWIFDNLFAIFPILNLTHRN